MKILVDGHSLNVEQHGPIAGPVVVLLHHGLGSTRAWRGQVPVLVEAGFHVVVYDRWGYGGSDDRPALDLPTFTTDLQDLNYLLQHLGVKQAALVGHSDGGTIALYYAARFPEQVSCLVIAAAHIYLEAKMEPGMLEVGQSFEQDERFRLGLRHAHGDKVEAVFHNWFDGWHKSEFLTWDMRPVLKQISCPTLVLQGEDDEHATPQHALDIAASIRGAQVWVIPGARHMFLQENAGQVNPKILNFLKEHAG